MQTASRKSMDIHTLNSPVFPAILTCLSVKFNCLATSYLRSRGRGGGSPAISGMDGAFPLLDTRDEYMGGISSCSGWIPSCAGAGRENAARHGRDRTRGHVTVGHNTEDKSAPPRPAFPDNI
ncbi:unnamed protein product [Arctogadus glacialis]